MVPWLTPVDKFVIKTGGNQLVFCAYPRLCEMEVNGNCNQLSTVFVSHRHTNGLVSLHYSTTSSSHSRGIHPAFPVRKSHHHDWERFQVVRAIWRVHTVHALATT